MTTKYQEYLKKVEEWRVKYKYPKKPAIQNLTELELKSCVKCHSYTKPLQRHHKGEEFTFACILEDKYAERYIKYAEEDVVYLCRKCHKKIWRLNRRFKKELWTLLANQNGLISYEQCEVIRAKIIKRFNKWLLEPKRKKRTSKVAMSPTIPREVRGT